MALTPTTVSGAASGAGFWSLLWLTCFKLDTIAGFCGSKKTGRRDIIFNWVKANKALSLVCTEVVNFLLHWKALTSPALMPFVLGGTLANICWIGGIIPAFQKLFGKKHGLV
jgi:hypothetical protein